MSESSFVVLHTGLHVGGEAPGALGSLPEQLRGRGYRVREFAIDDVGAMSEADWDQVLEAVLDSDRCITL